jgi:hypothetical protein
VWHLTDKKKEWKDGEIMLHHRMEGKGNNSKQQSAQSRRGNRQIVGDIRSKIFKNLVNEKNRFFDFHFTHFSSLPSIQRQSEKLLEWKLNDEVRRRNETMKNNRKSSGN